MPSIEPQKVTVGRNFLPKTEITSVMTAGRRKRIANPLADDPAATEALLRTRDTWGEESWPSTTVFTSGVYDLLGNFRTSKIMKWIMKDA